MRSRWERREREAHLSDASGGAVLNAVATPTTRSSVERGGSEQRASPRGRVRLIEGVNGDQGEDGGG